MDPKLSALIELQSVLSTQREIEREYEEIPRRREQILSYIQSLKAEAKTAEEQFKKHEVEQKTREMELQEGQSMRVKKEAQLLSLKTNKEYQATLSEIEALDRKNSRLEEKIIELMDLVEKERTILKDKQKELTEKETEFHRELEGLIEREKSLSERVEKAGAEVKLVLNKVDKNLYRRFLRVFDGKQGVAIAIANGGHCGACNIRLTARLIQLAKRGQDIVICEGCSRFLYWDHSLDDDQPVSL